jgi:DNA-binding transcriptional MerR regulator
MTYIQNINLSNLQLDRQNPRLSEFGITEKSRGLAILQILWVEMAVNELMYSIVSNGFWDYEPLIVMKHAPGDDYVTIEGNRRLAAVKLIHDPGTIKVPQHILDKITPDLLNQTRTLPCIVINSREESWRFVGFKHVNGPAKWGSFAKAKYIAEIHNDYGVPLDEIAYQIGDTNNTAQKLYQGLMVLDQAQNAKVYSYEDIQANRIYFSHLYTGLQREGIRQYLQIKDAEDESPAPVPEGRLKELGKLLEWLYGSKKNNTQPLIKSQNPDLKYLDEALQSKEATVALNSGEPLSYAYELSRANDALFEENILTAKKSL